jgi:hypothetical protein
LYLGIAEKTRGLKKINMANAAKSIKKPVQMVTVYISIPKHIDDYVEKLAEMHYEGKTDVLRRWVVSAYKEDKVKGK